MEMGVDKVVNKRAIKSIVNESKFKTFRVNLFLLVCVG